ncbi:hypothetical protein DFJ74DRAFT_687496 [Hyaloraphidium curvatum]|nr:hypothetical protein DFJ74DRAFT_687496 [Hyaloraphidium curvatum]
MNLPAPNQIKRIPMPYYPVGMLNTIQPQKKASQSAAPLAQREPRPAADATPLGRAAPYPSHHRLPAAVPRPPAPANTPKSAAHLIVPAPAPAAGPSGLHSRVAPFETPASPPKNLLAAVLALPAPGPEEMNILRTASSPNLAGRKRFSDEADPAAKRARSEPPAPQIPEEGEITEQLSSESSEMDPSRVLGHISKWLEQNQQLTADNDKLKLQLAAADAEIKKLRAVASAERQYCEEVKHLEHDCARLRGQRNEARQRHKELLKERNDHKVECANRCDKLEDALGKATKDADFYKGRVSDLDMQKAAVEAKLHSAMVLLENANTARADIAKELESAKATTAAQQSEIDRFKAEKKEAADELNRLHRALAAFTSERDADRSRLANLQQELDCTRHEHACSLRDLHAVRGELADLAVGKAALEGHVRTAATAVEAEVNLLKASIVRMRVQFVDELELFGNQ